MSKYQREKTFINEMKQFNDFDKIQTYLQTNDIYYKKHYEEIVVYLNQNNMKELTRFCIYYVWRYIYDIKNYV